MSDVKISEQNSECLMGKSHIEFDSTYSLQQSKLLSKPALKRPALQVEQSSLIYFTGWSFSTLPTFWNPIPLTLYTYMQLLCQHYVFNPLQTQKYHTRFMLRSGTNLVIFLSVQYSILPGAVWCGAMHTCSHTHFIDRFMMSEDSDPLSLCFTSKTGQSHSVVKNRQTSYFFLIH